MSFPHPLRRLNPFEGLCLTASDLLDEQTYHRRSLQRHAVFLNGYGIVQGLHVELEQQRKQYTAVLKAGYGITPLGQGVHLPNDVRIPLTVPKQDGEYMLWLFHVEQPDADAMRTVFDTADTREGRVIETAAPRMHAADEEFEDGVALCRITVRLGRMVQAPLPVPRAGRQVRASESYLKPRVLDFLRLSKKVLQNLFRTRTVGEISIGALGLYSAVASAEMVLLEEGTSDRVLYRLAGALIQYSHDFFHPLPPSTERIGQYTEFLRRVHAEVPGPDQGDETWLKWFQAFERLIQPLQRISDELESTIEAER